MTKRYKTSKNWYLMNMILFIGFSFEFFIRDDIFFGAVLIVNGLINLIAFQQVPRKIAPVTVILNIFNALISITVFYNYVSIDYTVLIVVWILFFVGYTVATIRQIINLIKNARFKRKLKKRHE